MAPLRWGLAAAGGITTDFVKAVRTLENASGKHQFVAVAARSLDKAKEFAATFDIPRAYEGYEALAKDPELDVVYVAPIHPAHASLAKMMIEAGKNVLVEKPLAMNVRETKEVVDLARAKGVFLMEALWSRFLPTWVKVREEIAAGTIGSVRHVDATLGHNVTMARLFKKELGGGSMLDLGVYPTNFILQAFGGERPQKVVATGYLNEEGTDTYVTAVFLFSGDRSASLNIHSRCKMVNDGYVYGDKGHMKIPGDHHNYPKIEVNGKTYEWPDLREGEYNYTNSMGLRYEAEHVRECLEKGLTESPTMPLEQSLLAAELMEDMRKQVGVVYPQDE